MPAVPPRPPSSPPLAPPAHLPRRWLRLCRPPRHCPEVPHHYPRSRRRQAIPCQGRQRPGPRRPRTWTCNLSPAVSPELWPERRARPKLRFPPSAKTISLNSASEDAAAGRAVLGRADAAIDGTRCGDTLQAWVTAASVRRSPGTSGASRQSSRCRCSGRSFVSCPGSPARRAHPRAGRPLVTIETTLVWVVSIALRVEPAATRASPA